MNIPGVCYSTRAPPFFELLLFGRPLISRPMFMKKNLGETMIQLSSVELSYDFFLIILIKIEFIDSRKILGVSCLK